MTTGAEFKDWALILVGNLFIVILIVRIVGAYAKREWGELLTNFCAAVIIAALIYMNEQFIGLLKQLASLIFGI